MNVIVCVDNRFGMLFNNRRVSRDKVRKKRAEKSIKADAHTMDDVCEYIVNELGYI